MARLDAEKERELRLAVAEAILRLPAEDRIRFAKLAVDAFGPLDLSEEASLVSFRDFIRLAWPVVEPETPFLDAWCVDAIAEHLEAVARCDIRRLVICIPRRMGKSILTSVLYPAWLFSVDPSLRLIFCSYSLQFVRRDAIRTRDLIRSPWYMRRYGSRVQIKMDQEQAHWFYTTRGGFRLATSPGSLGVGEGADIQVVDDPHKPQDVASPQRRQFVIDWWENTMAGSARDPNTLRRVVVQQRLHPSDLAGVCIAKGYEALILPMEYDGKRRSTSLGVYDKRNQIGELLWPERMGEEDVALLKNELGPRGYQAQCQQNPKGDEATMFKEENWRFWHDDGDDVREVCLPSGTRIYSYPKPLLFDSLIMSWDVAVSGQSKADYSVGQVWGRSKESYYLLDQVRFRGTARTFMDEFDRLVHKWPFVHTKLIEQSSVSLALIDILKSAHDGIVMVPATQEKAVRAEVVAHLQSTGSIYLPNPTISPWVDDFIDEFSSFPPDKGHDDQVDAASQALIYMKRKKPFCFA
ncbi:MAG: phage terminase large subunit [Candidatus Methanomethylicaceae archaeon]